MKESTLIEIRTVKEVNLEGGVIFDGFQSIGLTSTIACGCFINSLDTKLVAILDSPIFPPISIIYNSIPQFPARIYANEEKKLAFFVSELNLDISANRPLAETIIEWAEKNKCDLIISIAGKPVDVEDENIKIDTQVYGISNSPNGRKKINDAGIKIVTNGTVRGIPGILLNEGMWKNIDVIVFIVDVISGVPDFRAAAIVSDAISKIVPGAHCDTNRLLKEAEAMENNLKMIRNNIHTREISDGMYG